MGGWEVGREARGGNLFRSELGKGTELCGFGVGRWELGTAAVEKVRVGSQMGEKPGRE